MAAAQTATTENAWMKMIRRKRSKVVISRKTSTQAMQILEKSMVRLTAPPIQIGDRNAPT